jgi:hypothetical protein
MISRIVASSARLWIVVALCGTGIGVLAQAPQTPGPEHAHLQQMVGDWDVLMEMAGQKSKGTATYKSICDGMWVASDFDCDLGGISYQGHGMDGYDQLRKKYIGFWFDSMTSAPMQFEGSFDAEHNILTMSGASRGPDGKPQRFRSTTEMKGPDQMTFKMFMVSAADGKADLSFTIEYSRRKSARQ